MPTKTFEDAISQLEQIVKDLETGELPLEKSIKKFEEGVRLSKWCSKKLDETEKRVTQLITDERGELQEKPFETETGEPEDTSSDNEKD